MYTAVDPQIHIMIFLVKRNYITLFKGQLQSASYFGINLEQYGFFYMHFFKKYHITETHNTGNFFFQKCFYFLSNNTFTFPF